VSTVPNRETFESMHAGKPPWDIDKPQSAFVEAAERVTGAVLDAGCGTGENVLFFAGRGGIPFWASTSSNDPSRRPGGRVRSVA
jgi:hypothetical protein